MIDTIKNTIKLIKWVIDNLKHFAATTQMPKYLTAETYLISVPDNIKDEPRRNFLKVFDASSV